MTTRRTFLKQNSLLAAGALTLGGAPFVQTPARAQTTSGPIANTAYGRVRGWTEGEVHVFRGIYYGADTSGENRFKPPQKPMGWTGIRDAFDFGHTAPQALPSGNYDYLRAVRARGAQASAQGEDCLTLNVWTPRLNDNGKRAVLVSVHGGGYTGGTSNQPVFDGSVLARRHDLVVVTVNHRLGALGFLDLSSFDPGYATSGVVGLMDLVAALEWVRDSIAGFGGDPNRIFFTGQSGGGSKVCHMMAMPSAKGLFQRAGVQSGAAVRSGTRETAAANAEKLLSQLGMKKNRFRELHEVPFELLAGAQAACGAQWGPHVDGVVVPRDPFDPDAPAVSSDVPLLAGSNLNDSNFTRTDFSIDDAAAQAQLKSALGADPTAIWQAYRADDPHATAAQLLGRITSDRGIRANTRTIVERKSASGQAPAYLYHLRWPAPFVGGQYGSVHGTDLPLIFHNLDAFPLTAGGRSAGSVADAMSAAFAAFAKTGNPSTPKLPWAAYNAASKPTMLFDVESKTVNDPDHALLAMLPPAAPRPS